MEGTRTDSYEGLTFGKNDEESRERLRELILYIAKKSKDDPKFGLTKLNKLLYYTDFVFFARTGRPLTHAQYKKRPYGPVPASIEALRAEMQDEGDVAIEQDGLPPYGPQRVVPLRQAKLDEYFVSSEIALVDEVIQTLRGLNATEVSEMSHDFAWQLADDYEVIPYESIFIYDRELTESEINRAHELADRYGWDV